MQEGLEEVFGGGDCEKIKMEMKSGTPK